MSRNFRSYVDYPTALPQMPKGGFDVYLLDRKVIKVLMAFDASRNRPTYIIEEENDGETLTNGTNTTKKTLQK